MDTTTSSNCTDNLKFVSLNCYGYKTNSVYIEKLTKLYDAIHLTETWLTQSELHLLSSYRNNFHLFVQPANQHDHGRPFGGTTLLLRKDRFTNVDTILLEDFTTVVKTLYRNRTLTIIGVYLQSLSQPVQKSIDIYKTQLATITGALNQYIDISEPIILGDFQSCPDKPLTQRTAQPNALSKHLSQFIVENNLIPIDITQGEGPTYTYHHLSMPNKSYIDHVLIPTSLSDFVLNTSVLSPDALNTGDHLPVDISFNFPPGTNKPENESEGNDSVFDSSIPNYMWKNEKFISLYQQHVSSIIETKTNASSNADSMLNELHTIL